MSQGWSSPSSLRNATVISAKHRVVFLPATWVGWARMWGWGQGAGATSVGPSSPLAEVWSQAPSESAVSDRHLTECGGKLGLR